ncbi:MAG: ABC transporter ATP-binding protein [Candidatus Omnitrophica bacterium]|nr:ABC transporter ATP-binding protein [Candidatus Omnitrophota bacterium]
MLLEARGLRKTFKRAGITAVDGVSFSLRRGTTLGVVGESGCGKSTLAKLVLFLMEPDEGEVFFEGKKVGFGSADALKNFRKKVQIIFQEPFLSLDPRLRVDEILREPFAIQGVTDKIFLKKKVGELLRRVNLGGDLGRRFPHQLSGGECQRIAIARALSTDPELLVCDEPVSSLDSLTRAQVLNLLLELQRDRGISLLFISHDLRAVRHMSDEVLVMKEGRVSRRSP